MRFLWCMSGIISACLMVQGDAFAKSEAFVTVDCTKKSLQTEVDASDPGIGTTIFVVGECFEDITITKDAITLNGDPDGLEIRGGAGTINGQITVQGADNVSLEYLTITGPGAGLRITGGGDADVSQSVVDTNQASGIIVANAGTARITGTDITHNAQLAGLVLQRNAAVELQCNNVIAGNNGWAVWLEEGSTLRQQKCEPNIGSSTQVFPDKIEATNTDPEFYREGQAIVVFNGSVMDLRGADVVGMTLVYGTATFRAQSSHIDGDVEALANSLVGFRGDVTFEGALICDETSGTFGSRFGLDGASCGESGTEPTEPPVIIGDSNN